MQLTDESVATTVNNNGLDELDGGLKQHLMEIAVYIALTEAQQMRLRKGVGVSPVRFQHGSEPCNCPIVFGNPDPELVMANRSLRWLQLESVGFGEYAALDWTRPSGTVQVTNLAGFFADPVAESALAGILALCRGIGRLAVSKERAEWLGDPLRAELRLLTGANVVLFGYGAINRRLGELLVPFRCRVTRFARGWTPEALDAALAGADVVIAAVPDTPATRGLFDAARIAQLPRKAIFCNFGRGSLVDEEALANALLAGRIGGAVIDVTRIEPVAPDHPFWRCPNTILTQHSGGGTTDELDRKIDVFLTNLARFRSGAPLLGVANFSKGY